MDRDGRTCLTSEKIETQTGSTRSLHLRVHNGGVPLPASSLDLELPRSVTKAIHWLVECSILPNLFLPAQKT